MRERERQHELRDQTGAGGDDTPDEGATRRRADRLRAEGREAIRGALSNDSAQFLRENQQLGGQ
jgi:hypothetical protein